MDKQNRLRLDEVSRRTGYKTSTLRKKIWRREIACFKVGRILLVPETEVERLLSDFRPRVENKG